MLTDYISKLHEVYSSNGLTQAVKSFGKTFGEYICLEICYSKLNSIKRRELNPAGITLITGVSMNLKPENIEKMISESKEEFLNKIK